jgi:hypothetical protein
MKLPKSMGMHFIGDSAGEPVSWKLKHFANISGSEEFLAQLMMEMPELVDASRIYEPERQKLKEAIAEICTEGLMPAFEHLKSIRASKAQDLPELNRKQLYETFTIVLWRAYKDLMQTAAKMMEPEFGFLFLPDAKFESGLARWIVKRPRHAGMAVYFRERRAEWQIDLGNFRNYLEHRDEMDPAIYARHYEPAHAEIIFNSVWRTIADIVAMLVSMHLPSSTMLVEIPTPERDPVRPRRFRYVVRHIGKPDE